MANHVVKKKSRTKHQDFKKSKTPPEYDENRLITFDDISKIVNQKEKYNEPKVILPYVMKPVEVEGSKTNIKVINDDQFLVILKFLFNELNQTLMDMYDTFKEDRRKLFNKNNEAYINVVKTYLNNKEEFFICVLYNIKTRLNISQEILDNSFNFFSNLADFNSNKAVELKEACEKIFHAGDQW